MPYPLCNSYSCGWILCNSLNNDLWSWPISSRSFIHDIAIKLLKYGTSCHARCTAHTVLDGFFPYLVQMITSMRGCVACNGLWPWPATSKSFSHDFAIKLLKYGTSCLVCSTAGTTVLDGFSLFGTNDHQGVSCNDLWSWPTSSRLFSCDIAYFMDYIHIWHKKHEGTVSHIISRSIGQRSRSQVIPIFCSPGRSLIYNF